MIAGSDEMKEKYLPSLAEGTTWAAFGLTEAGAGSDAAGVKTTAVLDGDEWVLNGTKQWITIGGDLMDNSITSWVRRNYGCVIGESTAEKIKYTIGCASPDSEDLEMNVTGRNLAEGIPETFTLKSSQIYEAMRDPLSGMVRAIRNALELSPPELAADIAERGIVLTGGGALMRDLDVLISSSTGIPVIVAEDPLTCVARGGGKALEIIDKYNIDLLSTE